MKTWYDLLKSSLVRKDRHRMEYALLELEGGAKITALAEALHFSTPYAFSKAFKQHFGLSPVKFRQTLSKVPRK